MIVHITMRENAEYITRLKERKKKGGKSFLIDHLKGYVEARPQGEGTKYVSSAESCLLTMKYSIFLRLF